MKNWEQQSQYLKNNKTLLHVTQNAAKALTNSKITAVDLHTVCAVVYDESNQANSALLTPDRETNTLLGKAYGELGAGATLCYNASTSATERTKAVRHLIAGIAELGQASARVASVVGS
jgi:hypothetical protein